MWCSRKLVGSKIVYFVFCSEICFNNVLMDIQCIYTVYTIFSDFNWDLINCEMPDANVDHLHNITGIFCHGTLLLLILNVFKVQFKVKKNHLQSLDRNRSCFLKSMCTILVNLQASERMFSLQIPRKSTPGEAI